MTAPTVVPVVATERRVRRTQVERSAATRARLLDATIECLVEYGYAGTTVARVADRAAVTRGAQTHHFPTKEMLVVSAVRRLDELRSQELLDRLKSHRGGRRGSVDALLDLLWELHRGPVFVAFAEIWLAARTDPQLAAHVGDLEAITDASVKEAAERSSPLVNADVREAIFTAMDAMRGLVISTWHVSEPELTARWQRLRRHLRTVFPAGA
jgi:AcrR family transcriptional regulator